MPNKPFYLAMVVLSGASGPEQWQGRGGVGTASGHESSLFREYRLSQTRYMQPGSVGLLISNWALRKPWPGRTGLVGPGWPGRQRLP